MSAPHVQVKGSGALRQFFQIALHHGLQVGVDDDGGGALVFAEFGEDLVGDGKRNAQGLEGFRDC